MRARLAALAAAALLASLVLTGCGAPSGGGSTGDNGAATSGPADEGTDGDSSDGSGLEGQTTLPATYPSADVPLIEGDVVYAQDLGTGWVVYIARDDFNAGYDEAKGLLTGAGFAGDTVNQDDTGAFGQFTSDAYTVNLSSGDGADLGVGPSVGYTVVKN
ncbi:MAG: hypothetical protein ABI566_04360 [Pseudolysinimonas sp.]